MKFKSWCKSQGLRAKDIEEVTGISCRTIYYYWEDKRKPSRKREKFLKEVLGIPDGLFD